MSYKLLSEPIRKYVRDMNWTQLRPIQIAAISKIMSTDNNYILASKTASGKTEAAFLPILSKTNFNNKGVKVLYISPLIALINDQFYRIEHLCEKIDVHVTKWHGEANRAGKKELIKNPSGIVFITPESLEAMFVNAPYNISNLFGNLDYFIIDEIHSFVGTDRGIHLMSILSRIQQTNEKRIIKIGLSATIGEQNFIEVKKITGEIERTKILLDRTKKDTIIKFKYFQNTVKELPVDLINDLYEETLNSKALVFPNSRGRTEEVAVKLKRISKRLNGQNYYFSHHSSVDKEIRESVEHFAKNNKRYNFSIVCTSTLELGIDIGLVDKIIQIDSTHSVSSLVQRIGRSGRKDGDKSCVVMYATNNWSLLQALSIWLLYKEDFLESLEIAKYPYDILFHQILSILKASSGCSKRQLVQKIQINSAFRGISIDDVNQIIDDAISKNYIEVLQHELLLGIEGERIANNRDFYSVFKSKENMKIYHFGRKIGDIPFSPQIQVNENIFMAAKIWKIKAVDIENNKIDVVQANDGKNPIFFGRGGDVDSKIREKMLMIIKSDKIYQELSCEAIEALNELRFLFKNFEINNFTLERPVIIHPNKFKLYTFTGTKINRSLLFLIKATGIDVIMNDRESVLEIGVNYMRFDDLKSKIMNIYNSVDSYLKEKLEEDDKYLFFSKWGQYLSDEYKIRILKDRYFDFDRAIDFINRINFITNA
jgi:ATP-dependent Lhr-like helicase